MGSLNGGILAIWNDCRAGGEAAYEHWYRSEHFRERVGIAGFQFGRRYAALDGGSPAYFTYYETTGPGVLRSAAYLERGANPTPLTREIMTTVFDNMVRTICVREASDGAMRGGYAVTVRAPEAAAGAFAKLWPAVLALEGRIRSELWLTAETGQPASVEEQLRGGDKKIGACLFAEFASAAQAGTAAASLAAMPLIATLPDALIGQYGLFCTLDQRDLRF
jgi:hypothetical protein